jgi:hypothetical protein
MECKPKLLNVYMTAISTARELNQTVGEKRDLYVTLYQLEEIIKKEQESFIE